MESKNVKTTLCAIWVYEGEDCLQCIYRHETPSMINKRLFFFWNRIRFIVSIDNASFLEAALNLTPEQSSIKLKLFALISRWRKLPKTTRFVAHFRNFNEKKHPTHYTSKPYHITIDHARTSNNFITPKIIRNHAITPEENPNYVNR